MCQVFGYSKQAYYKQLQLNANTAVKEEVIVGLIKKKREIWKRGSGRNLHQCLQKNLKTMIKKLAGINFFIFFQIILYPLNLNEAKQKPRLVNILLNSTKILFKRQCQLRVTEIGLQEIPTFC